MKHTRFIVLAVFTATFAGTAGADFGTWDNAYRAVSGGNIEIFGVAADGSGNTYVAGRYAQQVTCGGITRATSQNLFYAKLNAAGDCQWLTTGGVYTQFPERMGIAVDGSGDVVVTGPFTALATFDTPLGVRGLQADFPGTDVFVAKIRGSDGRFLWANDSENGNDGSGADNAAGNIIFGTEVAVAPNGSVYVMGILARSARFNVNAGPVPTLVTVTLGTLPGTVSVTTGTNTLTGTGTLFVADARVGDTITLGDNQSRTITAIGDDTSLTVDANWTATCTACTYSVNPDRFFGNFVAKLTSDGKFEWVRGIQTNTFAIDPSRGGTIAIAQRTIAGVLQEEVYVASQFARTAKFVTVPTVTSTGQTDIFVTKLSREGAMLWTSRGGGPGTDLNFSLATDARGNAYVTSFAIDSAASSVTYGSFSAMFDSGSPPRAGVLARIDRDGMWTGLKAINGGQFVRVVVTPSGEPYLIKPRSTFFETITPGGGPIPNDFSILKFDRDLSLVWLKPVLDAQLASIQFSTAISPNLEVMIASSFTLPFSVPCDQPCATTTFNVRRADDDGDGAVLRIVDGFQIGREVNRPFGATADAPAIEILAGAPPGTDATNAYFFSTFTQKIYAVRPTRARFEWRVSPDLQNTERIVRQGRNFWTNFPQRHVTNVPVVLQRTGVNFTFSQVLYTETNATVDGSKVYQNTRPGRDLLLYAAGTTGDLTTSEPIFLTIQSFVWNDPAVLLDNQPCTIGNKLLGGALHNDPEGREGYVFFERAFYDGAGPDRAYDRATRRGAIVSVNLDTPAVDDDMVVVYFQPNITTNIAWPVNPVRYICQWPPGGPFESKIVIASELGSDINGQQRIDPQIFRSKQVYHQPDKTLPGYNPNEEHALFAPSNGVNPGFETLFALRNDLNVDSQPYTILKFRNRRGTDDPSDDEWSHIVYHVIDREPPFNLTYPGTAGTLIEPPYPLRLLNPCSQTFASGIPYFQDYKARSWARSEGTVLVRFFYPLQPNFHYDLNNDRIQDKQVNECVPWLDRLPGGTPGTPIDVTFNIVWPVAPVLAIGETLVKAKNGLPDLVTQSAAEVIYDDLDVNETDPARGLAQLIDALSPISVDSSVLPSEIRVRPEGGLRVFEDLPPAIKRRLRYDPINLKLIYRGFFDDQSVAGEPILLLNVMTSKERDRIKALSNDATFRVVVDELYHRTRNPRRLDLAPRDGAPDQALLIGLQDANNDGVAEPFRILGRPGALTAGLAQGRGFITLAFNNHPSLDPLPVSLEVVRVDCVEYQTGMPPVTKFAPYQGQIHVIESDNVFDEKLTLRHSGDFGGDPDRLDFRWYITPDLTGMSPAPPDPANNNLGPWFEIARGTGLIDITIEGPGVRTLSDNHVLVQYTGYKDPANMPLCDNLAVASPFAGAPGNSPTSQRGQLAEGWIKRVTDGLNPFEARVRDFHKAPANTIASLITQAGERYEGDIAFNGDPANLNTLGLISAYETVLRRGFDLSINASPPVDFDPANAALLNVASRISDFYMLLGNEAFADAADPTIQFGSQSGVYGTLAPAIFNFQNQLDSVLSEELVLLRGRDDTNAPTRARPVYNRLFWNFTSGDGELAYSQSYNVSDQNGDGFINETDARVMFPQGHGDAWGHYLTATTTYYSLLRHPFYTWRPRAESVLVAGTPIQVDFLDERKFARAAAAKAKAGAEIVDLTYRSSYVEDPAGQFTGYKDTNADRAWGVQEWARRAGQGAFFDWVVANSILPDVDPDACAPRGLSPGSVIPASNPPRICHSGITRIDRLTVTEIKDITTEAAVIQNQMDEADRGLNPLGVAKGVVPFDIDPAQIAAGKTHFEQVYDRALASLRNALTVFDSVNQLGVALRRNQDTLAGFTINVQQRESDFMNRLIEIFGTPYPEDIGPTGTYPLGYTGPDIYHYMYIDPSELTGSAAPETQKFKAYYTMAPAIGFFPGGPAPGNPFEGARINDGTSPPIKEVDYEFSLNGFGLVKPPAWFGRRRAPGDLQLALSQLYQNRALLEKATVEYEAFIKQIESKAAEISARINLKNQTISVRDAARNTRKDLTKLILVEKAIAATLRAAAGDAQQVLNASINGLPMSIGLATDPSFALRGTISVVSTATQKVLNFGAKVADAAALATEAAKQEVANTTAQTLDNLQADFEIRLLFAELNDLVRKEPVIRLETFVRKENVEQSIAQYLATLARGERVLDDLISFRRNTAAQVQQYRYEDLTFRVFRNDALQKYRAQFDLAARYAYLAATAYDFETNLLGNQSGSGRDFLTNIVRQRGIGQVVSGQPIAGTHGLADPLARMSQNFAVIKGQLGFNNPQTETNRFSLRAENERLRDSSSSEWRAKLASYRVDDLNDIPEFRRYCRPFAPEGSAPQPGLVVPFSTTVTFGQNFFGRPLGGGDSAYDPTHFATKVRSVGVWFANYNGSGLSNTPRVYLVPAGSDFMRSPSGSLAVREFNIIDQKIPTPFPIGDSDLTNPAFIPLFNGLSDEFADIRRFSSFRAFHDSGSFTPAETVSDTRLIGRSVWNNRWLLIIPGGTLLANANDGLDTFIYGRPIPGSLQRDGNGISDIKVFFQTYAYSGN